MNASMPSPFPTQGLRTLSPKEMMQRLQANSCTMPTKNAPPACTAQLQIGIFFDGTGNNRRADYENLPPASRKHSNVVKLYQGMQTDREKRIYSYYAPGVGTPFPEIGEHTPAKLGGAAGAGGEHRICWALIQILNAPHRYAYDADFLDEAQTQSAIAKMSSLRVAELKKYQTDLKNKLKNKKPKIEQLNISVFGFSRGAAQARAFVNWLFEVCEKKDGAYVFADMAIRVQFLGIFDTVASVGIANTLPNAPFAGHMAWADNNLQIHPAVEQCVHYVAGHEVRASFPLDSARVGKKYPSNVMEVVYPGSHSDVGGGYAPKDLGVSQQTDLMQSIIPGMQMYHTARLAGVPLVPMEKLQDDDRKALTPHPSLVKSFNSYLRDAKIATGPVENMMREHMGLYFSYRFKHRENFHVRRPYITANAQGKTYLQTTQNSLMQRLRTLASRLEPMRSDYNPPAMAKLHADMLRAAGLVVSPDEQMLMDVANSIQIEKLTPEIESFFEFHIHDSMAGFIEQLDEFGLNGIGIVRFRTVYAGDD